MIKMSLGSDKGSDGCWDEEKWVLQNRILRSIHLGNSLSQEDERINETGIIWYWLWGLATILEDEEKSQKGKINKKSNIK